jgi:DNA-binding protein HU-beta
MTKAELIAKVAKDSKITKAAAGRALDSAIDGITKALKKGDKVTLVGFGTFSVVRRKAREGRNPQTGKPIMIKAKRVAKFKAGSGLSKAVK